MNEREKPQRIQRKRFQGLPDAAELGKNKHGDPQITEALDCADAMDQERGL
jgi:hypothetical protein